MIIIRRADVYFYTIHDDNGQAIWINVDFKKVVFCVLDHRYSCMQHVSIEQMISKTISSLPDASLHI